MRFTYALLFATALVLVPAAAQKPPNKHKVEEQIKHELDTHKDTTGHVRSDLWIKGIEDTKKLKVAAGITVSKKNSPKSVTPLVSTAPGSSAGTGVIGVQWTQIGPAPLTVDPCSLAAGGCLAFQGTGPDSGQVTDIAIDPRNTADQTIYIATNDGGIWKSTDGGNSWKQKTDFMPVLSMGAVALDPSNPSIVYAGTGASTFCNGVINCFSKGIGVYKSIDSGDTWTVLDPIVNLATLKGLFDSLTISRMAVLQSGVLLVGTSGGLFRSVDGGLSFGSNAPNFNDNTPVLAGNVTDLHIDTATNTTVYAAANGGGIFQSTDSGATFPTNLFTNTNVTGFPAGFQYLSFAQSTNPNNQTFAANVQNSTGGFAGLYISTNTGGNWAQTNTGLDNYTPAGLASPITCQCGYDQTVGIDPQDAKRIFVAFQELFLSTNGSAGPFGTPVTYNQVHWDHHAITFSPSGHWGGGGAPTRLYIGTDGGIATSPNGTAWTNINNGIATNLLKHLDIGRGSSANNAYTYAGSQDTATEEHRPAFAAGEWHLGIDGDGNGVAVDPNNPMIAYGDDDGTPMFTTDAGATWNTGGFTTGLPGLAGSYRYVIDLNSSSNVFAVSSSNIGFDGDTRLFRSTTSSPPPGTFSLTDTAPARIRSIANVQTDSNLVWMGLDNGNARVTTNALATTPTFTTQTITGGLANVPVGGVAINPLNTSEVIAVYQGFCGGLCAAGNRSKHVFRTTDAGATWTDISGTDGNPSGNLPDLPLRSVVIDPGTVPPSIIVSSDTAVLRSVDVGATWQILGLGLPNVDSTQLAIDYSVTPSLLRVGTFGRSAFELTTATGPLLAVNANLALGTVCLGQSTTAILQVFNVGSSDLHISSIIRVSGSADFSLISGPVPVTVTPGEEIDYTIQFKPTVFGNEAAVFQINSDDPTQPSRQLPASGTGGSSTINTVIAKLGDFGNVCVGSFSDLPLTVADSGSCPLNVANITSSDPQFKTATVVSYPLTIGVGNATQVPIRFAPTGFITSPLNATITVASDDPVTPNASVAVKGTSLPPIIKVSGSTVFGNVCGGTTAQQTLQIANTGPCSLQVTAASINCPDFTIENNPFPATISADASLNLTIRFTPTSAGPKSCTLTITSNDPANPTLTFPLTASTPANSIDVPANLSFLPDVIQSIGSCPEPEPLTVNNTGTCPLNVTNMTIGGPNASDYHFSGLPSFPLALQAGHTVGDGNLNAVLGATALSRNRLSAVTVQYESDPITHALTTKTTNMCGEGVNTGARVLVTANGVPLSEVDSIKLLRITGNKNQPILNTVDVSKNLPLVSVIPTAPCSIFQYHKEYGTVSNPIQLLPGSYQVTVQVTINGKKQSQSVGFSVNTCGFNPTIVVKF